MSPRTDLDYSAAYADAHPASAAMPGPKLPPVGWWMAAPGIGNRSTSTPTLNEYRAVPWVVPASARWDRVAIKNNTAGGAGSRTRVGLHVDNGGLPGAIHTDFGTTLLLDTTATGVLPITIDLFTPPGLWWPAGVGQVAAPGWDCVTNFTLGVNTQDPAAGSANACYSHNGSVTGALPATFLPNMSSSNGLIFYFRRSA